jgi:hypothetical protein
MNSSVFTDEDPNILDNNTPPLAHMTRIEVKHILSSLDTSNAKGWIQTK